MDKNNGLEKKTNKKLIENAAMLYIMQFAGYFFSLMIIPYQTRVLTKDYYGALSLAQSVMIYFTMLIDYGFMVSGVDEIARNRGNRQYLNVCFSCIQIIKASFAAASFVILTILVNIIPTYRQWAPVFYIYLLAITLEALLPNFFFRGMEDMRTVAIMTLVSKACMTSLVFLFVKTDADYLLVPWMRVAGAALSFVIAYIYGKKKYGIRLIRVPIRELIASIKNASGYFVSRIASAIYAGGNAAVLGAIFPTATVAMYANPEKLLNVGMQMSSPIADSLLPHVVKTHDYSSVWRMMKLLTPVIVVGGTVAFIWAEDIMTLIFGAQYAASANVLRVFIPIIAMTPFLYILGFPVLVPMGLKNQSNFSNVIGAGIYVTGMLMLIVLNKVTIMNVSVLLLVTNLSVTIWRIATVMKYRERLKQ